MELELVGNQRDELTVGGLAFRVGIGNSSTNKISGTELGAE